MTEKKRILLWLSTAALCGAALFVWIGFLFPDPVYLERNRAFGSAVLWAFRIGIPVLAGAAVLVVRRVRAGKLPADRPLLALSVAALLGLLLYPVADSRYHDVMSRRRKHGDMHAFLQLAPRPVGTDSSASGPRVFCLGGSTTEFGDTRDRDWPSRVRERLAKVPGLENVSVINCGRQWYTTLHILILYETQLKPLRPDVIVVMETINDLLVNADFSYFSGGPFRSDYGHFFGPLAGRVLHRNLPAAVLGDLRRLWYLKKRGIVETDSFPGAVSFRNNLESLIDLAEKNGTRVALMTQPYLFHEDMTPAEEKALYMVRMEAVGPDRQWSAATAARGFRRYREALIGVAESKGVPWLDLEAAVPKTLEYFKDDVHYRDPAYDLVADAVAGFLAKQDLKGR
ncbi:MAG: SGNH/GDSL hydrolase family protein [bacterium]|nr:SGNH/GDSL hydrolase family protein [bacterium]